MGMVSYTHPFLIGDRIMKIIVTGFEPFGNETVNPSWEAVKALPDVAAGVELVKLELPVVYDTCGSLIGQAIAAHEPAAVMLVGQAGGRSCITPEFVAINQRDGIADNSGKAYSGTKIAYNGPDAFFSTLPVRKMVERMNEAGIPAKLSYTAGTYVCNNLMYEALRLTEETETICGFVHIPFSSEQAAAHGGSYPSMETALCTRGLMKCLEAVIEQIRV